MSNHNLPKIRFLLCIMLLLISNHVATEDYWVHDDLYVIRSTAPNGLVLDGTDPNRVTLQHFTGFSTQLWKVKQTTSSDSVFFVNNHTGKFLDCEERGGVFELVTNEEDVTRYNFQLWNVTFSGRIMNLLNADYVSVADQKFTVGNRLVLLWSRSNLTDQEFAFHRKV